MPNCWPFRMPRRGRFLVHELLGRGATATVFRGTDLADGRPVAIKVAEGPDPRQTERIHAEARILASLDHPAIVTFIAEGVVPAGDRWAGRPFIVEEFVYGGSLAERIRSGPADARDVAGWAAAALSGLAHVHARGLVHRDIKPANILLSELRRSAVRIADFGIATPAGAELEPGDSSGTVHYMSPEQAAGRHPGCARRHLFPWAGAARVPHRGQGVPGHPRGIPGGADPSRSRDPGRRSARPGCRCWPP